MRKEEKPALNSSPPISYVVQLHESKVVSIEFFFGPHKDFRASKSGGEPLNLIS